MSDEPPAITEHNNVTLNHIFGICGLNHERIAGKHGGQHAPSRDLQAQAAGRAQNLAGQFALQGMRIARHCCG
jgi:hypothetical protein